MIEHQDQSGHEVMKKNLHPSGVRDRPDDSPAPCRLSYLARPRRKTRAKGKGVPFRGHKGPRGEVDAMVHRYITTALGIGRVANPTLVGLYLTELIL